MEAFLDNFRRNTKNEINFDSFTKFALFCFKLGGFKFQQLSADADLKERFYHKFQRNYLRVVFIAFVYGFFSFIAYAVRDAKDFVSGSLSIPNMATVLLICLKTFITYYHKEKIWNICQDLKEVFAKPFPIFKFLNYGTMEFTIHPFALFFAAFSGFYYIILGLATDSMLFVLIKILATEFDILSIDFND
ncbi:CLUMA_CG017409, isoform A [Clunio marinus]|uniref:CLUMA_CG017409, isoform A n=1 Tax=Clunio marinus TaxID=568069 RepID=A0A1J1J0E7_9DIPT|nr:CLUMA_CG017409, isoform A [Clunio marinus]